MAKLHFRYGAMNAGKSTILIQTAYNYEERGQRVILIKPQIDTKGENKIVSRVGLERQVDELISKDENLLDKLEKYFDNVHCILVDEAQFLTKEQVEELFYITKLYDIPVIAFGLRTNFKAKGFEGSLRLLELADALEEMPTICRCGRKARFTGRKVGGVYTNDGETVVIDGAAEIEYEALCGTCYVKEVQKIKAKNR